MLKSIQSNNSPGHSHNRLPSVVDLSVDSCPGILLKRNNKMEHTKGKWLVNQLEGEHGMPDTFNIMAELDGETLHLARVEGAWPSDIDTEDKELEANANLIASAPEMFELLTKLRYQIEGQLLSTEIKQIDSIIAKVEAK